MESDLACQLASIFCIQLVYCWGAQDLCSLDVAGFDPSRVKLSWPGFKNLLVCIFFAGSDLVFSP